MQYELNILVTGGTASGKTSMLNAICSMIPANQRIVSIEGTRELNLPDYLAWNWIPLTTRNKNPEGKGEVTMLDLIANSMRMRPDRIIMGEVRRREEAEVLFEAMHTGHSVYATVHADTASHLVRRMTKPPFDLPVEDLESLDLIIVQFRDRRRGIRRTLEVVEVMQVEEQEEQAKLNYLYRWDPRSDEFDKINESKRLFEKLNLYTGMTNEEIKKDLKEKKQILDWMLAKKIDDINKVGETMGEYYRDREAFMKRIQK
jgi:flagellar protein FlaI